MTISTAGPALIGRTPRDQDSVALVCEGRDYTFGDVAALGESTADLVRAHGLGGRVVGVPAERSPDFVARIMGLWSAGAVPAILGDWSPERTRAALAATGAAALLGPSLELLDTATPYGSQPRETTAVMYGSEPRETTAVPYGQGLLGEASHILFTSGTTGSPKGIVVGRAAFEAASLAFFKELPVDESDRVAFLSRPGHDPSLRELLAPWLTGATLVIPGDRAAADPRLAAAWLAERSVTVLQATPVLLQLMAGASDGPVESLRLVCSVGARLTAAALRSAAAFAPRAVVANCYGASETPQVLCMHRLEPGAVADDPVPIGRPLGHAAVRVDTEGRLHVEAAACALGYTDGSPMLASGPDGSQWYDTGDIVSRLPDGSLCFVRRADRQVQVNGARVELDEIERAAMLVPGVVDARASFTEDSTGVGSVRLTVVRTPEATAGVDELRAMLRACLDPAVLPSSIEVDDPLADPPARDGAQDLWDVLRDSARSALGHDRFDPDEGFFEAGFTSMSLMRFVGEVSARLGVEISPVLVFTCPNLRAFADHLREDHDGQPR
ncbi:AMP-binding protein [Nonomuraea soli]|uniref:Acyl-coenzyme A synthetase/AMP-(Fatty) acid ligase/acyl carrier protein n=1 Tax=Nonomuraea soli TaxID=1032476 RepID=A0A7W0HW44_9ACTN|nr:AMP-binding protein [Nonomuraea soli]MBA2897820.1 acyl-coenzyme A synthetase/AMP-(fatty) acid ligase/acyl carrier protein [Nonomuraea soli]